MYIMNTTSPFTTNLDNSNYSLIFRKDTNFYDLNDIGFEIEEWVDILKKILRKDPVYEITDIRMSTRAEKFLMKTGYKRNTGKGWITINQLFLKAHSNPNIFHSVIAHEAIHTFPGSFNHGEVFKSYGRRLMAYYPNITISRIITDVGYSTALRQKRVQENTHIKKYLIECTKCGQSFYRERSSKLIQHPEKYRCGLCNGFLTVKNIV